MNRFWEIISFLTGKIWRSFNFVFIFQFSSMYQYRFCYRFYIDFAITILHKKWNVLIMWIIPSDLILSSAISEWITVESGWSKLLLELPKVQTNISAISVIGFKNNAVVIQLPEQWVTLNTHSTTLFIIACSLVLFPYWWSLNHIKNAMMQIS